MEMHVDDSLYQVDDVWLGPESHTLLWQARYRAYGVFFATIAVLLLLLWALDWLTFWPIVYAVLIAVYASMKLMEIVNHERPARSWASVLWHELHAPRARRTPAPLRAKLSLARVRRAR